MSRSSRTIECVEQQFAGGVDDQVRKVRIVCDRASPIRGKVLKRQRRLLTKLRQMSPTEGASENSR